MKKVFIFLAVLLFFSQSTAFSLTISLFNTATQQSEINAWKANLGGQEDLIENFEKVKTGWYNPSLTTSIGTFSVTEKSKAGTGTSSYNAKNPDSELAYFEIRDYNANGRKNHTDGGSNYLDSADITELKLTLLDGLNLTNMFFYLTDPSDVKALTRTKTASGSLSDEVDINYNSQNNNTLWFVGIVANEAIESVLWTAYDSRNQDNFYTNDGFGLDDFSTMAPVPEPSTILLLGSGLLGLGWYGRKRKKA